MRRFVTAVLVVSFALAVFVLPAGADKPEGEGWVPLFNGKDLAGWTVPKGGEDHWKVLDDGVLDYDARSRTLWTEKSFGDFVLHIEWRLKTAKDLYGSETGKDGKKYAYSPDSGIFVRGHQKAQTNIWLNSMGSGEVWGYRTDKSLSEEARKQYVPKVVADKPHGEWNVQEITMKGDHLTVELNGKTVIDAPLPGVPESGPIGLQQHGGYDEKTKRWRGASSCIQFRNIYIKELK